MKKKFMIFHDTNLIEFEERELLAYMVPVIKVTDYSGTERYWKIDPNRKSKRFNDFEAKVFICVDVYTDGTMTYNVCITEYGLYTFPIR